MQAGSSLLLPCTSTMHRRQAPISAEALEVAEARDRDALLVADVEDRLVLARR